MNNQTLQWTSRGSGQCPVCQSQYSNAWKPENCANCGHHIGGTYVPRKKRPKLSNPDCVQLAWQGVQHLFSVRTSPRGDRCFVLTDESVKFCHHEKCKGARAVTVGSPDASVRDFTCEHIDKTTGSTNQPEQQWVLNDSLLVQYPGDQSIKETLRQEVLQKLHGSPAVFKVASNMFVAFGPPSASSPLGYVHVSKKDNVLHCTSKHCRPLVNVSMGKQHKVKKLCIHQHLIFCLCRHLFAESLPASSSPTTELPAAVCNSCPPPSAVLPASPSMAAEAALQSTSTSSTSSQGSYVSSSVQSSGSEQSLMQSSTIRANITRSLPYKIPVEILQRANEKDAATVLNLTEGEWPNVFSPEETSCSLCESKLSEPRIHPGSDGKSYILTNANPFRACKILVKICPNKTCKAMHQVWPYDKGLFNLCDKFLVAFSVLLEWREAFKRGVPISVAIGSKLDTWCKQIPKDKCPTPSELRYASRLLYNGFYSFEIITLRSLDNAICGICGTIGEFYLGDGNEKNCCTLKGVRHEKSNSGSPCTLEVFLAKLKQTWIHRMLFSNDDGMDETIIAGEVPPIIAPYLRGQSVQNTEMEKRSIYLSSKKKDASGDPALLHRIIIDEKFSMENLETCELAALKQTAERCKIPVPSGASKSFVIGQLRALYATLLVGSSPCHGFDSLSGHTGGFYHIVCRHGCTVASKFLLLQESVRDAADLYLSLRYPPPVFICDTPCTFTKHMDVRCPDVSGLLWGDNSGCFEKPVIGRKPIQQSVPEIVPLEYRSHDKVLLHPEDLAEFQHPVSGVKQRYVLGDRFHTATEPHKSPLCGYHDIRLCAQSLSIKTSFQESENHRKNFRRLRSSTMQSFPVHFLYNYLMDFYHNEQIVDRQVQEMRRVTKEGQAVSRDQYHRLVITGPK